MIRAKLIPLYIVIFIASLGYSMMIAIFTPLVMGPSDSSLALRMVWLGLLLGLYPLGQLVGAPLLLRLSNRLGQRTAYLCSLALTAMGYAWIALSLDNQNWFALIISVFVTGFSESNVWMAEHTVTHTVIARHHPRWLSYIQGSASAAFLIGPILAGTLTPIQLSFPFWAIFLLLLASLFSLVYSLPETERMSFKTSSWKLPRMRPFYLQNFLIYFSVFGFFRAYPMDLVYRFGMDTATLARYIAWVAVPIVISALSLTGYLLKRFPPRKLAAFGICFSGVFMFLVTLVQATDLTLWVTLFFAALGIGFCLPACPMLIAKAVHKNERESVLENDETLLLGSETISSIVGGFLAAVFIGLPLIVFAVSAILASAFLMRKK
jgi:DHA1 family tetracycline resistance protein-like MFS transporter